MLGDGMRHMQGGIVLCPAAFFTAMKNPAFAGFFIGPAALRDQSPRVSSEALPPAAVVFTVTVFSVAKRSR